MDDFSSYDGVGLAQLVTKGEVTPAELTEAAIARIEALPDYRAADHEYWPVFRPLFLTGWLIAVERTRSVLVLQLWVNGVNVALDLWFVLGLGWGVPGVAAATLIAEWSGLALGLWLCRDGLIPVWRAALARIGNAAALRVMARATRGATHRPPTATVQPAFCSMG